MNEISESSTVAEGHKLLSLRIEGSYCISCVASIVNTLLGHDGVVRAAVSIMNRAVTVEYDPERIEAHTLESSFESAIVSYENGEDMDTTSEHATHDHQHILHVLTDPVCNMVVDSHDSKVYSDYEGKRYFFCTPSCKHAFDTSPSEYLNSNTVGGEGHA